MPEYSHISCGVAPPPDPPPVIVLSEYSHICCAVNAPEKEVSSLVVYVHISATLGIAVVMVRVPYSHTFCAVRLFVISFVGYAHTSAAVILPVVRERDA